MGDCPLLIIRPGHLYGQPARLARHGRLETLHARVYSDLLSHRDGSILTPWGSLMPDVRKVALALALGAACFLAAPGPIPLHQQASFLDSTAHAQQDTRPGRIDFYLPPARVSPPAPRRVLPPAVPRVVIPRRERLITGESLAPQYRKALRRRPRPGLFTVSRVGRRLLYRKGYLGDVPVHLIVADLNDPEIKIGLVVARAGIGTTESFASMVRRTQPAAALTGTFFGLKNALPTGDLVVNGRAIYQGFVGTAVAFTEGNMVSFIPTGYKEKTAWPLFDGVVRGGPLLVQDGNISVGPREEGFISLSAAARRSRTAVGITPGRKLLLMAVKAPVSLWQLAKLMRSQGAYHAVAMDGGTSTGLYFGGQMIARPGRTLTNALVVYGYQQRYEQAKRAFLATPPPPSKGKPAARPLRIQLEPAPVDSSPSPSLPADPAAVIIPGPPIEPARASTPAASESRAASQEGASAEGGAADRSEEAAPASGDSSADPPAGG
jgi:hypothetical protein